MTRWSLASSILLVELALAAEVAVFTAATGPLRVLLGMWVVLVAPGWAVLRLLDLPMGVVAAAATAVGISMSIDILLALALFYARWWSVELAMTILLAMIVLLVLADLPAVRRAVGRRPRAQAVRDLIQP